MTDRELLKEARDLIVMCSLLDKSGQCEAMADKIDKQLSIANVSSNDILILLERKSPTIYEIHRGKVEQSKNLILTTKDKEFAERLVNGYNQ